MTFDLPIRFQQVSEPVPSKFTLNTKFRLMKKRELWLSEDQNEYEIETLHVACYSHVTPHGGSTSCDGISLHVFCQGEPTIGRTFMLHKILQYTTMCCLGYGTSICLKRETCILLLKGNLLINTTVSATDKINLKHSI
jgi:hypothetical protein